MTTGLAERGNNDEIRLLLVGKTGTGKSATANTIVGKKKFKTGFSAERVTTQGQLGHTVTDGQKVAVMDTPGLFASSQPYEDTAAEVVRCLTDLNPGPHAVLYVVSVSERYTKEDDHTYSRLKNLLGEDVTKWMIVILTHGDVLENEGESSKDFSENVSMRSVLVECHQRYVLFNNESPAPQAQQLDLIRKVQQLGGGHYVSPYSDLTSNQVKEEVRRRVYLSFHAEAQSSSYVRQLEQDVHDKQMARQQQEEALQETIHQDQEEKPPAEKERRARGGWTFCRCLRWIIGIGILSFIYKLCPVERFPMPTQMILYEWANISQQSACSLFPWICGVTNSFT